MKKHLIRLSITVCVALVAISFIHCSDKDVAGATETGNAGKSVASGRLYASDGSPAVGAIVRFIAVDHNPHANKGMTDTTVTDENGDYGTDMLDSGTYNIFGEGDDDELSLLDSVVIDADTVVLENDTIRAPGSISGYIKLQPGDESDKIIVIVMGSQHFSFVNSDAGFELPKLAEGEYSVKFFSTLDKYSNLDTTFTVTAGKALLLPDSIVMPFNGIPAVTGLTLAYDTLKQIVTLSWDRADSNLVAGYNIYRKHSDSAFVRINVAQVQDTVWRDSSGVQDESYEYQVVAVDEKGEEGGRSSTSSLYTTTSFKASVFIESGMLNKISDLVVRQSGAIYVSDDTIGILIFDSNGEYQRTIFDTSFSEINLKRIVRMVEDSQGNLFISGVKNKVFGGDGVVLKLSPDDSLIIDFGYAGNSDSTLGFPKEIVVSDSLVYVENTDDRTVKVFSPLTGDFLFSFGGAGDDDGQFVEIKGMTVNGKGQVVTIEEGRIQIFDPLGVHIQSIDIDSGVPNGLIQNTDELIYTLSLSSGHVIGIDETGNIQKQFQTNPIGNLLLSSDDSGVIYIASLNYSAVLIYEY